MASRALPPPWRLRLLAEQANTDILTGGRLRSPSVRVQYVMNSRSIAPLRYNSSGVMLPATGLSPADLVELAPRLEQARAQVLDDARLWQSGGDVPAARQPLDAGFVELPERLLDEYGQARAASELGRILSE